MLGLNADQASALSQSIFAQQAQQQSYYNNAFVNAPRPTRCTTHYNPGGMGFLPSASTQCF